MTSLKAYAKINLGLRIIAKRPDGYHDIETILANVSLHDQIEIAESVHGIKLFVSGLNVPRNERNLAYQAASLFLKEFNIERGITIRLHKRIPVGGGLGGGSADAVAVLKGMRQLFKPYIPDEELLVLGQRIGMDVPFFFAGGAAEARGRGDELEYFNLPAMSIIIHHPGYPISTRWAYGNVGLNLTKEESWIKILRRGLVAQDFVDIKKHLVNDFESLVFRTYPELQSIKEDFLARGAKAALLSGSGSCVYAIVDELSLTRIAEFLKQNSKIFFVAETIGPAD